jgi:hypothetical protein
MLLMNTSSYSQLKNLATNRETWLSQGTAFR